MYPFLIGDTMVNNIRTATTKKVKYAVINKKNKDCSRSTKPLSFNLVHRGVA